MGEKKVVVILKKSKAELRRIANEKTTRKNGRNYWR